jgi:hypothetical protein
MSDAPLDKEALAAQLALQGLQMPAGDLDGMLGMARDLAASGRSMQARHPYALESLSGFTLVKKEQVRDE